MSKLLLATLLFVAVVLGHDDDAVTGQHWENDIGTDYHYGYYVEQSDCTTDCSTDMTAFIKNDYCYIYFYRELGCAGQPTEFIGFAQDQVIGDYDIIVQQRHASIALYECPGTDDYSCEQDDLPGNIAIGCTDYGYNRGLDEIAGDISDYDYNSALVICDGKVECARDCMDAVCGDKDMCGPCSASCEDDGYYCMNDGTTFQCLPQVAGEFTYFTTFYGYDLAYLDRRGAAVNYDWFTYTHFENAFIEDIARATGYIVPEQAIIINAVEHYIQRYPKLLIWFTINVDLINDVMEGEFTINDIMEYTESLVFVEDEQVDGLALSGPFTMWIDLDETFIVDMNSGDYVAPSDNGDDDDEWKSFGIPDSMLPDWEPPFVEDSASSAVACLVAVGAALVAQLW